MDGSEDELIRTKRAQSDRGIYRRTAFTLVELLVVISVMAALAAIMVPVLSSTRRKAYSLVGMTRLKHIATQLNSFALDSDNRYPPSISRWPDGTTDDPRRMVTMYQYANQHRSLSAYLSDYIEQAEVLHCPSAPDRYPYLDDMWQQGDDWVYPGNSDECPMTGNFTYYWNYQGLLEVGGDYQLFNGPSRPALGKDQSDVLVSDALVQGDQQISPRPPESYSSCEYIPDGNAGTGSHYVFPRWTLEESRGLPDIRLKAAFVDTHVEYYRASKAIGMRAILGFSRGGRRIPWPSGSDAGASGGSLGLYYLPPNVYQEDLSH